MEILILSCGTGGGHNAAGAAVKEELEIRGHNVEVLNPYTLQSGKLANVIDKIYIRLVQKAPSIFGFIYKIGNLYRKLPFKSPVYFINGNMVLKVQQYLESHRFDAIVMPHLFPAEIITQMKKNGCSLPRTIFVATDYTCIPFTEETDCDYYIIPSEDLKGEYIKKGIDEAKIKAFGIPTKAAFQSKMTKEEAKCKLGLSKDSSHILIFGGSIGAGKIEKVVKFLYRYYEDVKVELIVICGNNDSLYAKLNKEYKDKIKLIRHTDDMAEYLKASDVVIAKPGGLSSTEAAVTGAALIHMTPIPGCETYNMRYFITRGMSIGMTCVRKGIGIICDKMMKDDVREKIIKNQHQHIYANATKDICDFIENK